MKWTGRKFSEEEMQCLAATVVRESRLDYEDHHRIDQVLDFQRFGNAIYVAIDRTFKESGDREVSAMVIPLRIEGRDIRWKHSHESMLPQEQSCPERIMKLLTPTTSAYAEDWRRACRLNIARAWRQHGIYEGMLVVKDHPLLFSGSVEARIFRREAERDVYTALSEDGVKLFKCRIPSSELGLDFTVWGSLELFRASLQESEAEYEPAAEYEPWIPQFDDRMEAAQLSLF